MYTAWHCHVTEKGVAAYVVVEKTFQYRNVFLKAIMYTDFRPWLNILVEIAEIEDNSLICLCLGPWNRAHR